MTLLFVFTPARDALFGSQSRLYRISQTISSVWDRIVTPTDSVQASLNACEENRAELANDIASISELERQVAELQSIVQYQSEIDQETITARVLASSASGHELLIDKGSEADLETGSPVVVEGGHLIGLVSDLSPKSARIRLLSSEDSSVGVSLSSSQETIGLVEGENGFLLHLNFVPQDIELKPASLLITSLTQEYIPAGLVVGQIQDVTKEETALFHEATVAPLVDASTYSYVVIILSPEEIDS